MYHNIYSLGNIFCLFLSTVQGRQEDKRFAFYLFVGGEDINIAAAFCLIFGQGYQWIIWTRSPCAFLLRGEGILQRLGVVAFHFFVEGEEFPIASFFGDGRWERWVALHLIPWRGRVSCMPSPFSFLWTVLRFNFCWDTGYNNRQSQSPAVFLSRVWAWASVELFCIFHCRANEERLLTNNNKTLDNKMICNNQLWGGRSTIIIIHNYQQTLTPPPPSPQKSKWIMADPQYVKPTNNVGRPHVFLDQTRTKTILLSINKKIYTTSSINNLDGNHRRATQKQNATTKLSNEDVFCQYNNQPGLLPIMILQSTRGSCNMIQKSWTHQPNHNKYKNWLNTRVSLQNKKPTKMNTQQSTNKVQGTILIHSDDAPIKQKIKIYQSQSTSTDGITKKVTWKSKHVTINQKDPSAHHYVYVYLFVHQIINLETSVYSE